MFSSHPTVLTKCILTKDQKVNDQHVSVAALGYPHRLQREQIQITVCVQKAKNNSQAEPLVPLESFPPNYENLRNC